MFMILSTLSSHNFLVLTTIYIYIYTYFPQFYANKNTNTHCIINDCQSMKCLQTVERVGLNRVKKKKKTNDYKFDNVGMFNKCKIIFTTRKQP